MKRAELLERYRELTMRVLPARASALRWPIRLGHCFQRIVLDNSLGAAWYTRLTGRPAYRQLTDAQLRAAVRLAELIERSDRHCLQALNRRSLQWRGKVRPDDAEAAGASLAAGRHRDRNGPMNEQDIRRRAEQFVSALHALDQNGEQAIQQMAQLFAADAVIMNPALKLAGKTRQGNEAVRAFWVDYCKALPRLSTRFHAVTVSERAAGLFWTSRGEDAHGQPVDYDGASFLEYDDQGLIERFRGYYDTRELVTGAGQVEELGHA